MTNADIQRRVEALVREILQGRPYHLIEVVVRGVPHSRVVTIYVDTERGITADECAALSLEVEQRLDLEDFIGGRYRLEVSSPGVDRPLAWPWQYRKNIGRLLRVRYLASDGERAVVLGRLCEADTQGCVLETSAGPMRLPYEAIEEAVVQIEF
ncbi:MAG: ribosome maturation factor RimP [Bacteroidota bacterium]|nr:ribosome maturation factor RimP [Rhodothermia bacterium]MDW8285429.1 ribosome maturation factor RimP [Bacteroidota bacterium]